MGTRPVAGKCLACGGSGKDRITQCPLDLVSVDAWDVIESAELYAKGLPPVAGGSEDQAVAFVQAARVVWACQRRWKRILKME